MSHGAHLSPQGTPEFTWRALESVLSVKPLRAVLMNDGRAIRKIKDFPKTGKAIAVKLLQYYWWNWFSPVWERSSANNSHLRHQNKVLVDSIRKKTWSPVPALPVATWESLDHSDSDFSIQVTYLAEKKKQWNDATQPQTMILLQSSQNALVGRQKAWVLFQKQKNIF